MSGDFTAIRPHVYVSGAVIFASNHNTNETTLYTAHNNAMHATTGHQHTGATGDGARIILTTGVSGVLPAANGGSGQSSYAVGDLLYASGATALSKLADVAVGNALISGGVGVAPSWGKITSSHVNSITGSGAFVLATAPTISGDTTLGSNTSALPIEFIDDTNNRIYYGNNVTTTVDTLTFEHQHTIDNGATLARVVIGAATGATGIREAFWHNSSSPAISDDIWQNKFYANNNAAAIKEYARVFVESVNVTPTTEAANYIVQIMVSGTLSTQFAVTPTRLLSNLELELPDTDPPTANYMNRNSGIKAWLHYTDNSGSVTNAYNITSVTDDDGDGIYNITWDTNMGDIDNYAVVGNIAEYNGAVDGFLMFRNNLASGIEILLRDYPTGTLVDGDFYINAVGVQ